MTRIHIDAHEVIDLGNDLERVPAKIGPKVSAAVRRTAFAIEGTSKMRAPVDTGALKSSISTDITGSAASSSIVAEVGPTVDYGGYVELGTSRMHPQPFMGPAFDQHIDPFTKAMAEIGAEIL